MKPYYVSKESLQKLEKEYDHLTKKKRIEMIDALKNAADLGDLKENAEWDATTEELDFLDNRIQTLENILKNAIVYSKKDNQKANLGSTVTLKFDSDIETYQIVGNAELSFYPSPISHESPLGSLLIGKKVGDSFLFQNAGEIFSIQVLDISE